MCGAIPGTEQRIVDANKCIVEVRLERAVGSVGVQNLQQTFSMDGDRRGSGKHTSTALLSAILT
jgi:hypothetical protein